MTGRGTAALAMGLTLAFALRGIRPAEAGTKLPFAVAPTEAPAGMRLLTVTLNGLPRGTHVFLVAGNIVSIPPATAAALGIRHPAGTPAGNIRVGPHSPIGASANLPEGRISLTVPANLLGGVTLGRRGGDILALSPETWGADIGYDANFHTGLYGGDMENGVGAYTDLHGFGPDMQADASWAFNSTAISPQEPAIRLDSSATWLPSHRNLAVTAGDALSLAGVAGRAYRFAGLRIGTDHSAQPGWSGAPLPSLAGSAAAPSVLDLYVNGARAYHAQVPGGPFRLRLPPGATDGARLVVTDVTGRVVTLPVVVPRISLDLLARGVSLWSAGIGAPRFDFGSYSNHYLDSLYAYGNYRWGVTDRITATLHGEAGPGLVEAEGGALALLTPTIGLRLGVAGSRAGSTASLGVGGAMLKAGFTWAALRGLYFDASYAHTLGHFEDVVSWSARSWDLHRGFNPIYAAAPTEEESAHVAWSGLPGGATISIAWQNGTYPGQGTVGFASGSLNATIAGVPAYLTVSQDIGGIGGTSVIGGVAFRFGGVDASLSGGVQSGGAYGAVSASQGLGNGLWSHGWSVDGTLANGQFYGAADAELRTGRGITSLGMNAYGSGGQGYVRQRGTIGLVDWHPFLADPVDGGLVVVNAGHPGVEVRLDGARAGTTSWLDGRAALPIDVPGVPHRVSLDEGTLSFTETPIASDASVVVRDGGATAVDFSIPHAGTGARVRILLAGQVPPVGSMAHADGADAPIDRTGDVWLPDLKQRDQVRVTLPDGRSCTIPVAFQGPGGLRREIGPYACAPEH